MATEKRHFRRVVFSAATRLIVDTQVWDTQILDISFKGALIAAPTGCNLTIGTQCAVELRLDEAGTLIALQTHVVHITNNHFGLRCDLIDPESLTHLRRLIELNLGDAELANRELAQLKP